MRATSRHFVMNLINCVFSLSFHLPECDYGPDVTTVVSVTV